MIVKGLNLEIMMEINLVIMMGICLEITMEIEMEKLKHLDLVTGIMMEIMKG